MSPILMPLFLLQAATAAPALDPFLFLRPTVTVTAADRRQLDRGEPVARALSGKGNELAVFAAVRVDIDGDRLVHWMRRIGDLKKSAYVLAISRFSEPPVLADLAALTLDDEEASDLLTCRPGSCGLKVSAGEMERLQQAAADADGGWIPAVQRAFRAMLLERVETYLDKGRAALAPYENHGDQIVPAERFAEALEHTTFLTEHLPRFADYLRAYPHVSVPGIESFVYWSKERIGGKVIISATHVSILRGHEAGLPEVLVAGAGISATHYLNASLGVTALVRSEPGAPSYLIYVNRSDVDMPGGFLGALVRPIVKRRLKAEAGTALEELRRRLQRGEPPPYGASTVPAGTAPSTLLARGCDLASHDRVRLASHRPAASAVRRARRA